MGIDLQARSGEEGRDNPGEDEHGLDQGGNSRCWWKGPDVRYILKVIGFVHKCEAGEKTKISLRFPD